MKQPSLFDYLLLIFLALIWASAFFNIKIATYSFGPITIAFLRVFFGSIPVLMLCYYKKIKLEAFSKDWHWFAMIGFINLVAPFYLIDSACPSLKLNNGGDNGVDNRQLNAVNEAIRSHPVEIVGKELRGYMTAMEKISTAEGVGIGQVNS